MCRCIDKYSSDKRFYPPLPVSVPRTLGSRRCSRSSTTSKWSSAERHCRRSRSHRPTPRCRHSGQCLPSDGVAVCPFPVARTGRIRYRAWPVAFGRREPGSLWSLVLCGWMLIVDDSRLALGYSIAWVSVWLDVLVFVIGTMQIFWFATSFSVRGNTAKKSPNAIASVHARAGIYISIGVSAGWMVCHAMRPVRSWRLIGICSRNKEAKSKKREKEIKVRMGIYLHRENAVRVGCVVNVGKSNYFGADFFPVSDVFHSLCDMVHNDCAGYTNETFGRIK